ncbi:MAG TPA: ABC transporter ATP-binding protein [Saprospiraceae bacterium]|nr:ABC transporter ATP-binding protein [Saprospiraceae bacterium]
MIRIEGIKKSFGKSEVLKDINLQLKRGQCIGLIGPNACGKTTLIKSILSMVLPNDGTIYFDQKSIAGDETYKNKIGYMPQIGRYPENMSIIQVIDMIKSIRQFDGQTDEELWDAFGLEQAKHKKMRTLSGGTTQKVSATLAFLFSPDVLILDEPTAGLDPLASEILREKIIMERQKGKLILITSHLLNELDDLLTDVIYMQDGKIVFFKTTDELMAMSGHGRISKAIGHYIKSSAV